MNTTTSLDTSNPIAADDIRMLERVMRFLIWIQQPSLLARARAVGFSPAEQKLGWEYYNVAAGVNLTVDDNLAIASLERDESATTGARYALLRKIDDFENQWMPRVRSIIRRVVPEHKREAFLAAFFDGLEQQPLGPTVVGSVEKLLVRVKALEDGDADSKRVRKVLRDRGLNDARVAAIESLLAEAKDLGKPASAPDAETVAKVTSTREVRAEAMTKLTDWFVDWSTMLRTEFSVRDQIRLGIGAAKKPKKKTKEPKPA